MKQFQKSKIKKFWKSLDKPLIICYNSYVELRAPLAQLVEQLTLNQWVLGSSPRWCTNKGPLVKRLRLRPLTAASPVRFWYGSPKFFKVGVYSNEVTPVPIPNTEVKLICVEDTWLATAWKNRTMPALTFLNSSVGRACGC